MAARMRKRSLAWIVLALFSILLILAVDLGVEEVQGGGSLFKRTTLTVTAIQTTTIISTATMTGTTVVATTQTSLNAPNGGFPFSGEDCLFDVPQNATLGSFGAANVGGVYGTLVSFSDGLNASFPVVRCPQPVDHAYFEMAMAAVTNSTFIAMENGSAYHYAGTGPTVTLSENRSAVALQFNTYGNETGLTGCGATYGMRILGQISVLFFPSSTGSPPDLSSPEYSYAPASDFGPC
jgi:hypothetical protein